MSFYHEQWFKNDCNNNCAITFPINENSVVIDLGAYRGIWAQQIINKYNPFVVLIEPNNELCLFLKDKFKNNPKVKIINIGISNEKKSSTLFLNGDGSSLHIPSQEILNINCITIEELLFAHQLQTVDLMQINIEGEEYSVLNNMIETGVLKKIKNLQIQFHDFIQDASEKRTKIQEKFKELNFSNIYDYPFVFEAWRNNNDNL